jgi:hypothetical protein
VTRLIESQTVQILPGGTTLTTLHLSPEARRSLSIGEALIPSPRINKGDLTVVDFPTARIQQPSGEVRHALRSPALYGTIMAIVLYLLGAPALVIIACQAAVSSSEYYVWKCRRCRAPGAGIEGDS